MGTYIYSLRSPKHIKTVELDNGYRMTVGLYKYEYKESRGFFLETPRWYTLMLARMKRMENIWHNFINGGGAWPKGGVFVYSDEPDKINVGDPVYCWTTSSLPITVQDVTFNNGLVLGKVSKVIS